MGTRLFIGNLSYNVTEQELKETFTGEGIDVRSVRVALDRETGRPRGFAFVETMTDEGAKASIEKLSGRILQGRPVIVEEAQAKPAGPRPGGGYGGPRPGGGPGGGPGGFGSRPPGGGPGGPPRGPGGPGGGGGYGGGPGMGGPRPAGGPPRDFGPPRAPGGGFRAGGFDNRGPGPAGGGRSDGPPRRERPEKKRSTRPKPEERERGNWRWDRSKDDE
ncbi:MAG TPA: RNA-binding protein [Polyangia bacterium]|nr:RNA-binding protein [Polyangia bacterium]